MFAKKALSICLILTFLITGCSAAEKTLNEISSQASSSTGSTMEIVSVNSTDSAEDNATKLSSDTTFYNDFFGFSFTVPAGWWLYHTYEDNFDRKPGTTASISTLDAIYGENYVYFDLLSCGNLQYSTKDNHVGLTLYIESIDGVNSVEGYYEDNKSFLLEPYEDETYEEISTQTFEINGKSYIKWRVNVIREQNPYVIDYYFFSVNNNHYATANFSYWPDNTSADTIITELISSGFDFN